MHDGGGGHFGGGDFGGHAPHTGHDPGIHHGVSHHGHGHQGPDQHNTGDTQWYAAPDGYDPVRRGRVHAGSALGVVLLAVVLIIVLAVTI